MPITVRVGLEEDGTGGVFWDVSSNGKGFSEVWEVEDRV